MPDTQNRGIEEGREAACEIIEKMGDLNPEGDPHGLIDPSFTRVCREWSPSRETDTVLTLEEWRRMTREVEDFDAALGREILDATDPLVFLVILRDRLVFSSGCADVIITLINCFVDPYIVPRELVWQA
jgi:hypothetical protein